MKVDIDTIFYIVISILILLVTGLSRRKKKMSIPKTGAQNIQNQDLEVTSDEDKIDMKLSKEVETVQNIISLGLALRKSSKIKVRQPLMTAEIVMPKNIDISEHIETIKEELNVK